MDKIDFRKVAEQLAHPQGADGIQTALRMNQSNGAMTKKAIEVLDCKANARVLEIGPGNGKFASYVLEQASGVQYAGTDISDTMIAEARRINRDLVKSGHSVDFRKTDGRTLPYAANSFDRIFTVNTVYFWADPDLMLQEIRRILCAKGVFCLAFASKAFMESLPFTDERFRLYTTDQAQELLLRHGFTVEDIHTRMHETTTAGNTTLLREEIFISALAASGQNETEPNHQSETGRSAPDPSRIP